MKFEQVLPALRAGKKIRRKGMNFLRHEAVLLSDLCGDDWEIEPETRELSRADIERAWNNMMNRSLDQGARAGYDGFLRELGFEKENNGRPAALPVSGSGRG